MTGAPGATTYNFFNPTLQMLSAVPGNAAPTNYDLSYNGTYATYVQNLTEFSP